MVDATKQIFRKDAQRLRMELCSVIYHATDIGTSSVRALLSRMRVHSTVVVQQAVFKFSKMNIQPRPQKMAHKKRKPTKFKTKEKFKSCQRAQLLYLGTTGFKLGLGVTLGLGFALGWFESKYIETGCALAVQHKQITNYRPRNRSS